SVCALGRRGPKPGAEACGRRIMQEPCYRIKDVAAGEEAAEYLRVVAVQPLAAELDRVLSRDHGESIANLRALEHFVDIRLQEKGPAKREVGGEAHGFIRRYVGFCRGTRTVFARKTYVALIHFFGGNSAEDVGVHGIDLGRALGSVGRIA